MAVSTRRPAQALKSGLRMQREGAGGSAGGALLYSLELGRGAKAKGEPGERAQAGRAVKAGDMAEVEGRAELPGGGEDEFPKPGSNRWVKFSGRGSEIKRNWKVNIPLPFFSRGKAGEESNESKQGKVYLHRVWFPLPPRLHQRRWRCGERTGNGGPGDR